jgi:hypothetical protein
LQKNLEQPLKSPRYYPEDIIAIAFSVVILFVQLYYTFTGYIKDFSPVLTTGIALLILFFLIVYQKESSPRFIKFLRSYIHIPYYGIIFSSFQSFVHKLNPADYDNLLLKADLAVFGFDITRWLEQFISEGLTEALTLSYFSYYVLPTLTFIFFYFSKDIVKFAASKNYLLAIVIGWYSAFIFYLILPAAGPDIAFPEHYTVTLQGLSPLTNTYLENLGKYLKESFIRNTFPSMHFGIILITNYFAFRYKRKYFWLCTLPLGTMLAIATVYLRQHYLIDLLGSLPIAAFSIYLAYTLNLRQSTVKK